MADTPLHRCTGNATAEVSERNNNLPVSMPGEEARVHESTVV